MLRLHCNYVGYKTGLLVHRMFVAKIQISLREGGGEYGTPTILKNTPLWSN